MRRTVKEALEGRKIIQYSSIEELIEESEQKRKSKIIALGLNFLLPGAGDAYCGLVDRGIMMFIVTVIALFIHPTMILIMWPILVYDAKIVLDKHDKTIEEDFQNRIKKCPLCKKTILKDAKVCEFCLVDLNMNDQLGYSKAAYRCPFCWEEINKDAIKCKHCGSDLRTKPLRSNRKIKSKDNKTSPALVAVLFIIIVFSFIGIVSQFDSPRRSTHSSPEYIKDISCQKEGSDGFLVYFTLADNSRALTVSDGIVKLSIVETKNVWREGEIKTLEHELFTLKRTVKKGDFWEAKLGRGVFERDSIIYTFERMTYSSFNREPTEMSGKVIIEFKTPDGRVLKGEDSIFF